MKTIRLTESELIEMIQQIVNEKQTIDEEKDRCYRCAVQSYGNKNSAYRSGAMERCRAGKIWKGKKC